MSVQKLASLFLSLAALSLAGCGSGISGSTAATVAASGLQISAALPPAVSGMMYSSALQASGGSSHYTWSVVNGSVPDGLQLEKSTGVIAGVPKTSGTAQFAVAVTDDLQVDASRSAPVSLTVVPQLIVAGTTLPVGQKDSVFLANLTASGGQAPYTWALQSGQLPAGLFTQNGIFAGIPTQDGTFSITLKITDAGTPAQVLSVPLTLKINAAPKAVPALSLAAPVFASGTVNSAYSAAMQASGGTPAYTWAASGKLPPGLVLSSTTGTLSGTPTTAGTYTFAVQVTDSGSPSQSQTAAASVTIAAPAATPLSMTAAVPAAGTAGTAYAAVMQASGGTPAYTWTTAGALPPGLSLNASTGSLAGTPTTAGTYAFSVQVADSGSPAQSRSAAITITISAAPTSTPTQPISPAQNPGTTWYVRKDGGTRYSGNRTNGQCDGKGDGPYKGTGVNQHCAFNDVRFLYLDGGYNVGSNQGWVIAGGDTVIIRGSIDTETSYRIGWNNNSAAYEQASDTYWGIAGDPYSSGMPAPPSGTAAQHTRILGENYGSCHAQSARTQLHGGFGVSSVIDLKGTSYVELQCLDVTDFSACGRSGQANTCNTNLGTLDDYASTGIAQNNTTSHLTITDVRIHGTAGAGLFGPNGDGNVYSYIDIVGNASSGWDADNGTLGIGSALMQNFSISWNGCSEEYPIQSALPYNDCTDDNVGGYGDGFGTATLNGTVPWNVTFDTGTVSYNTQDGLDALHLVGAGSTMTINRVQAFGNMGQQIKVGGAGGTATNNLIVTSCNAMRGAIPGTPDGYNKKLSDFCRAADTGIYMAVQDGSTTRFDYNTIYSAAATTVQIGCGGTCTAGTDLIDFRNNIILGFKNTAANGYVGGGSGDYANPIYVDGTRAFTNKGSYYDHNVTFHAKSTWSCPSNAALQEKNAICADPGLADESWHGYGIGVMSPVPGVSLAIGAGVAVPGVTTSMNGQTRGTPPTIGAYE